MSQSDLAEKSVNYQLIEKMIDKADVTTILVVITTTIITVLTIYLSTRSQRNIESNKKIKELRNEFSDYITMIIYISELYDTFANKIKVHKKRDEKSGQIDGMLSEYENIDNSLLKAKSSQIKLILLLNECGYQNVSFEKRIKLLYENVKSESPSIESNCESAIDEFKKLSSERT
ncbi:hypothetical protein BCU84_20005 [Shewanella sp. 10N.286.51.B7]|uniref:hypothetical protein n=1 Tax=Shewanella sp. 10N.286.51.B7 TaxID=1880836 RepID=UPI000C835DB5|nr:hypothetical protein [Shewanella sp. 10N.286.51.B7]PMG72171.1 hypothetical protein BCU84_20005 [Shewanella sp. 10N.286.51.B7]